MFRCMIHSDCPLLTEIPEQAVQIASTEGNKALTFRYGDGSFHVLKKQSSNTKGGLGYHKRFHRVNVDSDCPHCQPDSEFQPNEPEVYDYTNNPDDWFSAVVIKQRTNNYSIGRLENDEKVLISGHYPIGSEVFVQMERQAGQYPYKAINIEIPVNSGKEN